MKLFSENVLKDDKCHMMIFGDKITEATVSIRNSRINESGCQKLFGVTFDKNSRFKKHGEDLYKKANQNLQDLARL